MTGHSNSTLFGSHLSSLNLKKRLKKFTLYNCWSLFDWNINLHNRKKWIQMQYKSVGPGTHTHSTCTVRLNHTELYKYLNKKKARIWQADCPLIDITCDRHVESNWSSEHENKRYLFQRYCLNLCSLDHFGLKYFYIFFSVNWISFCLHFRHMIQFWKSVTHHLWRHMCTYYANVILGMLVLAIWCIPKVRWTESIYSFLLSRNERNSCTSSNAHERFILKNFSTKNKFSFYT